MEQTRRVIQLLVRSDSRMASDQITTPNRKKQQPQSQLKQKQKLVQVGNYKLMSLRLGEGATAKVELAFHTILKTKVALKIINLKELDDKDYFLNHLEREAKMMARLNHPNVARLFEVQSNKEHQFLMMELFTGGNLLDHLKANRRLVEDEARNIYGQILSGLGHIHSRGVVHRDLKLENIMLDKTRMRIAITDFGLSTRLRAGESLKTRCGTQEYAAPELLDSGRHFDKEVSSVLFTFLT